MLEYSNILTLRFFNKTNGWYYGNFKRTGNDS